MNAFWVFWLPVLLLFVSTAVGAVIKNRSRDACLKRFNGSFALVKTDDDRWYWGDLSVFSTCLELRFRSPIKTGDYLKHSYIFFEPELQTVTCIYRPVDCQRPNAVQRWRAETRALLRRGLLQRARRRLRNFFNILRDAFSQSVGLFMGFVKTKGRLAAVPTWDQRGTEIGQKILSILPNAYEPALEKYIGREVVLQSIKPGVLKEQVSILQEYTDKFVLLRDISLPYTLPPDAQAFCASGLFDAIFSRRIAVVRHLAEKRIEE